MLKLLLETLEIDVLKNVYLANIAESEKEFIVRGIKADINYFTKSHRWTKQQEIDNEVEKGIKEGIEEAANNAVDSVFVDTFAFLDDLRLRVTGAMHHKQPLDLSLLEEELERELTRICGETNNA